MSIFSRAIVMGSICLAIAPAAMAHDHGGVRWSVNVGVPGPAVYGPPVVYQPQPVYVAPAPVYVQPRPVYVAPAPAYYYRNPGHWRHQYHHHHHHYRY